MTCNRTEGKSARSNAMPLRQVLAATVLALGAGVPSLAPAADVMKGGQLYSVHCAACHGRNGMSVVPNAPSFGRGERMMQPDMVLLTSVRSGRNAMPGFLGMLSDREILDIIAYLRTLR